MAGKDERACGSCAYFSNDPAFLEREIRGLSSLSSAYASVRSDDGLCTRHQRYVGARARCSDYRGR